MFWKMFLLVDLVPDELISKGKSVNERLGRTAKEWKSGAYS